MESKTARAGLILLIMYDKLQAPAFTEKLRGYGYDDVVVCSDGKTALEKLKKIEPSVVISDVELKGEFNGIETGKKIRENWNIPIIFLSRLQDERTFQKALDTHPQAFLNKPVNWNELRMAIESAMYYRDEKRSVDSVLNEFRQKFEEAPLPYQILDASGNITAVNRAWTELMGYSADEVTGRWFGDFVPVDFHPRFKYNIDSLKKDGHVHRLENELIKKDGSKITIAFEGKAQNDLQGKFISTLCIFTDITEKQRIKEKLLESEERFRLLFEEAPLGYHSLAENGGIIYVNDAWCKMLGYSKKEATGKWFGDFLAPEERDRFKENFSVFRQKGKASDINYKMIKKDGSKVYIMIDGIVHYDEEGNYIQSHCILKDITAQKLAEDALLESEKKFRNLIESAGDIIYLLDNDLKYIYGNNLCLERYGLTKEELIGKNYRDFHSVESSDEFNEKVRAIQKSKKPIHYEHQSTIDGRYFLRTLSPIMDSETKGIESITVISRDITGLKNMEKAVRKSENEIRTITDNIPALVSYVDASGHYRFVNRQYEKWFGIPSNEIIGKHSREVLGEIAYEQVKDHIDKVLSGQQVTFYEELNYTHGGTRWVSAEYIPDFDDKGKVSGFFALVVDITGRKQADEQLRTSEERYRKIFDNCPIGMVLTNRDFRFFSANPKFCKMLGYTEEELKDMTFLDITHPDYREADRNNVEKMWHGEIPLFQTEKRYIKKNGDIRWVNLISTLIRGQDEKPLYALAMIEDITEHVQSKEKLVQSEERYRQLVELSPDAIMIHQDGKFVFVNSATLELFGAKAMAELIGQPIMERIHPDYRKIVDTRVKTIYDDRPNASLIEAKIIKLDGSVLDVESTANEIPYRSTVAVQVIARDITKRKQAEEKLRESEQKLKEAQIIGRIGSWEFDVDHDTIEWSDETYELYERDPALGPPTPDEEAGYYTSEQAATLREYSRRAIETGEQFEYDLQARLPGGRTAFFSSSMRPIRDESGRVVRLFGTVQDITERKRIETELQNSKQMLQTVLDTIPVAVFWKDRDLIYQGGNPTFKNSVGLNSTGEIIGKTDFEFPWDEDQAKSFREYDKRIIESGIPEYNIIEPFTQADGTHSWARTNKVPMRDEKGNIIGILGTNEDITERKRAEEALLTSQAQLSNAMEIARLGYWEYDVIEDVFTFDDHFYNIFRTSVEKVGGYKMSSARYTELFVHPEDMQVVSTETRKAIETTDPNYSRQLEHRMIFADGQIGYILVRFYIIKDDKGRTIKTYGANQDITERKKVEKALEESETMLRSILRSVSVGIGVVENRIFEWTNETYQKITGFSENELKGKSTRMVYPDDEEFKRSGSMYNLMKKHGVGSIEVKHKHKNGNIIDVLINIAPIIPGDLNSGVAFTLLDITERKKAEIEILEKSEDLSLLVNINRMVNSGADIDSITSELSGEIKRIFDCDGAAIMMMDEKEESIIIRNIPFIKEKITGFERLIGQKLTGLKIKVSTDFIQHFMLESRKVQLFNSPDEICRLVLEYAEHPLLQKYIPDIIKLLGINSVIIIPLVSNNLPIGIIEISSRKVFKQNIFERITNLSENLANIIARKQAESALKASETRFRAFMENLPVMTYMKDKEGKFIYGNKAILKFADRTPETYTGSLIDEFLPGDLASWMKQMDKKVLITNKTADLGEWKWVKENREQWFKEFKFPIFLPDKETIIGGWMMDITTKKAAESALKESETLYKDLVEKAGLAIMTDDNEGKITYFNHEFAKFFGYSMAGFKEQTRETLIHSKDLKKMVGYHNKRMKGGLAPDRYEIRGIQKNGNEIWMEVTTTVLSKQDKIIGTRNYIWDITEQKKTLQELENSVTRFRELFSNMSSGVAIYEYLPDFDQFIFRDMNEAGFRITRITDKEKIVGRNILEVLPGVKSIGLIDVMRKVVKSGKSGKLSASYYKDDRIELYIDNYVYKLPTGEIVSVFDDITERIVAEQVVWRNYEEIRKLSQHLETIREEERKQIAGELHDELGQILTAIKMDVSWIRNKMPQERRGIKKRAGSTIQIIDEAIGSVQRLSIELRPRMLDDLGLLETLKAFFKEYKSWANISVRYDLPEKEPDLIPGQGISVFRIIQESLTNIARHAGATEVKLIIKVRNDNLDLNIQDNGIGIPDEKVHSSESYGILNMRERVQRWGGKFEIKGEKGAGTTISAIIPIGEVQT